MGGLFGSEAEAVDAWRGLEARVAEIERTVGIRRPDPSPGLEAAVADAERAFGVAPPDDDHGVAAAVAALVGGGDPGADSLAGGAAAA